MRRRHKSSEYPVHLISGYVRYRVPLFELRPDIARLFMEALCFYRRKYGLQIFGYVVMPDHYHLLLGFPPVLRISNFLRDFKSYVGKQGQPNWTTTRRSANRNVKTSCKSSTWKRRSGRVGVLIATWES